MSMGDRVLNMIEEITIQKSLLAYWIDIIFEELHDGPSDGLLNVYRSMNGVYLKCITAKENLGKKTKNPK
jgi:hypothetical protein